MTKNNINWQELEREEKQFKDERTSHSDRHKRPYKRERQQGRWWDEYSSEEDEDDSIGGDQSNNQ
jgi:hypothetical protein